MDSGTNLSKGKKPHTLVAFAVIIGMCLALVAQVFILKDTGPIQVTLFLIAVIVGIIGLCYGYSTNDLSSAIMESISRGVIALLILTMVGILVGAWMASGTIPLLIYIGLNLINPSLFLFTACVVCMLGSLATGSSWTAGATFGVAIFGIGSTMGIPAPMIVGAIVSGAYFGDKLSPLSDTTNLASAVTGADIFDHIKSMMYSSGISMTITLIVYLIVGFKYSANLDTAQVADVSVMLNTLKETFSLNPIVLIPAVLIVVLAMKKVPAVLAMGISIVTAVVIALLLQGAEIGSILTFMKSGFTIDTGVESVNKLLCRGGYEGMLWIVSFTMFTLSLGGLLEKTKILDVVLEKLGKLADTQGLLILTHTLTSLLIAAGTASQVLSILLPGRLYIPAYKKLKIKPEVCSRVCEDSGTIASVLIPWAGCAIYFEGLFGVSPYHFLPWALFIYLSPITTVALGFMDKFIFKYSDEEYETLMKRETAREW